MRGATGAQPPSALTDAEAQRPKHKSRVRKRKVLLAIVVAVAAGVGIGIGIHQTRAPPVRSGGQLWSVPEVDVLTTAPERVIVVGAGVSGLAAARALVENGIEVVVLEANDHIGGRTRTVDVGESKNVELGAFWVSGIVGNPIADVIEALGFDVEPDASLETARVFDEGGSNFNILQYVLYFDLFYRFLEQGRLQGASLGNAIDGWIESQGYRGSAARLARFTARSLFENLEGAPVDLISLEALLTREVLSGGDHVPVGGWTRLLDYLAEPLDIRTSEPVATISWDVDGVSVSTARGGYRGSHVIVTAPLGVIKAGSIDFESGLPQAKREAIARLGVGDVEKVALSYDEVWWGNGGGGEGAIFVDNASELVFPYFLDFTSHYGAPTLIGLYSAFFAQQTVQANWTDDEIVSGARAALSAVFGQDPEPVATALSHWTASPFTLGAYSYVPVGATVNDLRTLAQPVDGRVLFAGEATAHEPAGWATVHGAFLSGLREAKRLGVTDFGIRGTEGH